MLYDRIKINNMLSLIEIFLILDYFLQDKQCAPCFLEIHTTEYQPKTNTTQTIFFNKRLIFFSSKDTKQIQTMLKNINIIFKYL